MYLFKDKDIITFVGGHCKLYLFHVYRFRCDLVHKETNVASRSANASSFREFCQSVIFSNSAIFLITDNN